MRADALSPFGVHVILIEPGPIRTHFKDAAFAVAARDPASPYAPLLQGFEQGRKGWYVFELPPERVAETICRAARSRRPRARYTVTLPAKLTSVARRVVPDGLMDWTLRRAMGRRSR